MRRRSVILQARRGCAVGHICFFLCSFLILLASRLVHAECNLCTDASRRGTDCPPWAVCSVHLGDCESGLAPAEVCTGHCTAGGATRLVFEAGVYMASDVPEALGARLGVELVPPVLGGHLAVHGDWWTGDLWQFGPRLSWALHSAVRVGASADIGPSRR